MKKRNKSLDLHWEKALWDEGADIIVGADEVGVSAIAGPLLACAVILPPTHLEIEGVNDSKTLKKEDINYLAVRILEDCLDCRIGLVNVATVQKINIYRSSMLAIERSINALTEYDPDVVFIDHFSIEGLGVPQISVDGGDAKVYSIACASIIAKAFRDKLMKELDIKFPEYGFKTNVGYPTPYHWKALEEYGSVYGIHRLHFQRVAQYEVKRSYKRRYKRIWNRNEIYRILARPIRA